MASNKVSPLEQDLGVTEQRREEAEKLHHLKSTDNIHKDHALHNSTDPVKPQRLLLYSQHEVYADDIPPTPSRGSIDDDDKERQEDILFRRRISQAYLITNIFHICMGITTLIITHGYASSDDESLEHYFIFLHLYHEVFTSTIMFSSIVHIYTGVVGVLWTNACKFFPCHPIKLFNSYENYLNIILALNMGAATVIVLIGTRPSHKLLNNVMLTEAYHMSFHSKLDKSNWSSVHIIDDLQRQFKCCGVHDYRDWLFSPGHFIPESCCNTKKLKECHTGLIKHNFLRNESISIVSRPIEDVSMTIGLNDLEKDVVSLLWSTSCINALQTEVTGVRVRWSIIICVIVLFQTVIFGWSAFLCKYVRLHLQYEIDMERMRHLRVTLKVWESFREHHFGPSKTRTNDVTIKKSKLEDSNSTIERHGIPVPEDESEHLAEKVYEEARKNRNKGQKTNH